MKVANDYAATEAQIRDLEREIEDCRQRIAILVAERNTIVETLKAQVTKEGEIRGFETPHGAVVVTHGERGPFVNLVELEP